MIAALALLLTLVQQTPDTSMRRVEGRVTHGLRTSQLPLAGQWVVLHRVGHDRAGPLDSMQTGANGRYAFRYRASGDTTAIYFATTSFGGIVYPTSPFRGPDVRGDNALITVFDTTSGPITIKVAGRHLIVGAPNTDGRRPIGEIFDLENDSTVTAIAKDSVSPIWATHIPEGAVGFRLNTNGDLAAGAISQRGSTVGLLAPLSPGIRQLAFTYELPSKSFPLRIPVEGGTGLFEVMVQEPAAHVTGPALREVPPQSAEGRVFRRFLAQDVPSGSVVGVDMPENVTGERTKIYLAVGAVILLSMIAGLIVAARRSRVAKPNLPPAPEPASQALLRELASLDDAFERTLDASDGARQDYARERELLKRQLADALEAERQAT